jgi:hypothetical protein
METTVLSCPSASIQVASDACGIRSGMLVLPD